MATLQQRVGAGVPAGVGVGVGSDVGVGGARASLSATQYKLRPRQHEPHSLQILV